MKVILKKDVPNLGKKGDVKEVSIGYARNFLFKNKLAALADENTLKMWEKKRAKLEKIKKEALKNLKKAAEKLSSLKINFTSSANDQGTLFASIDTDKIIQEIKKHINIEIERKHIHLKHPLKKIGEYKIKFRIEDIEGEFIVNITKSSSKPPQKKQG